MIQFTRLFSPSPPLLPLLIIKIYNFIEDKIKMSSRINEVDLYQMNMNYDKHRLKVNGILSHSSPSFKDSKHQNLLQHRNAYKNYNSSFKRKQNSSDIQRKNQLMMNKLVSLSRVSRHSSTTGNIKIRDNMNRSRLLSKRETTRSIDLDNSRFVKQLKNVKSTIKTREMNRSFSDHMRKSQMLSKFTYNRGGSRIPKNSKPIESRIKLEPIHLKLKVSQTKIKPKVHQPLAINLSKLMKNPETRWQ